MSEVIEYDEVAQKLDELRDMCNFIPDVSTDEGYQKSKRVSLDVGKVLTALEKKRKERKAFYLEGGRRVDSQAKSLAEQLEKMQEPHKLAYKQLDDAKKERERARKQALEDRCIYIEQLPELMRDSSSDEVKTAIEQMNEEDCIDFYEFTERALKGRNKTRELLTELFAKKLKEEAEKEELDRLRKEAEAREQAEHEERIRREAAAQAEAEKQAAIERERLAKESEERAKQEAEEAKELARIAAVQAEEQRKRDAEEAERRRIEAEERAAAHARLAEIARQEAEAKAEEAARKAREENRRHVGNVRREAKEALMQLGITEDQAKAIVLAINDGKVPNVKINY